MSSIEGTRVVVIGGTSGIGLATAIAACEAGAEVWAASRSEPTIAKAREAAPDTIQFRQADTHDTSALEALFSEVGTIDHLITAATGADRTMAPFMEQTEAQFEAAFDKFRGYARVARTGVPYLADEGTLTLTSGIPARKCNPNMSAISCVGAAVEALVRALALELAPRRVNAVAPGIIDTPMFDWMGDNRAEMLRRMGGNAPLQRVGTPEEVANAYLFLLTTPFVTGTVIDVDGGQLLP